MICASISGMELVMLKTLSVADRDCWIEATLYLVAKPIAPTISISALEVEEEEERNRPLLLHLEEAHLLLLHLRRLEEEAR